MGRIGSAVAPSFSADGKWVSFLTNISGVPQVWIVPVDGGYPRMVTNGDDPVVSQKWSPAGDWLAVTIAPGGGLNSQVYVVKPDGTGMRLLTQGGQDNNAFDDWTDDGKQIAINSNRRDPASRDSFMIDLATGEVKLVARNPGIGSIENISRDDKRALTLHEKNGLVVFIGKGRCARCHNGLNFTDNKFQNIGAGQEDDKGRFAVTAIESDRGAFKTPSLRNVEGIPLTCTMAAFPHSKR